MRAELFWLLSFGGFAALSLVCGLVAWPQLVAVWPIIREQIDRFLGLPPLAKVVPVVCVAGLIAYGGTKTNQVDQTSGTNAVEIVEGGTNDVDGASGEAVSRPLQMVGFRPLRSGQETASPFLPVRG